MNIDFTEEEIVFLQKQAAKHEQSFSDEVRIRVGFIIREEI